MMCCSVHRVRAVVVHVTGDVHMISCLGGVCQVFPLETSREGQSFLLCDKCILGYLEAMQLSYFLNFCHDIWHPFVDIA